MKAVLIFLTLAATLLAVTAQVDQPWTHRPTFAPPPHRFRRDSQATATATLNQGKPTLNLDVQGDILKNDNGALTGGLSAQIVPHHWDADARLQGEYQLGHGQLTGSVYKPLTGSDRTPTFGAGYHYNIWEGQNGRISAGVDAMKLPHQHFQPYYGIQGTYNFPG